MSNKEWHESFDYKDMTPEQQVKYIEWKIIPSNMGIPTTSINSFKLQTRAFLEKKQKNSFWD